MFLNLLKCLREYAPDPVGQRRRGSRHRDETRHIAFVTEHLRYVLQPEPEKRRYWPAKFASRVPKSAIRKKDT